MNARQLIEIHPRLPLGFIHGSLDCVSDFSTFILVFLFDIFYCCFGALGALKMTDMKIQDMKM